MSAEVSPPAIPAADASADASASLEGDAAVHPAGAHQRGVFRWGYFLIMNGIAGAIAIAIFFAISHGEWLDPYMVGTYEWLLAHPMMTSAMAFSPLAASMLVGWGYSQRARKRRAAAAEALARSAEKAAAADAMGAALATEPASAR